MQSAILAAVQFACDLDACREYRESWGCFRDRRPDLYGSLRTLDGGYSMHAGR